MVIKQILIEFRDYINLKIFQDKWRKNNINNATSAGNIFQDSVVSIGDKTYGTLNVHYYKQSNEKLSIGKYCSIANDVQFFLGGEHNYKTLTSFPFKNRVSKNKISEAISKGEIIIEDDVWIGYGAIILSGSKIGRGAVIGAGSVVSGVIPPYAIYIGNSVKKYRFSNEIINKLLEFDLSEIKWENIENHYEPLYREITEENVKDVIREIRDINCETNEKFNR